MSVASGIGVSLMGVGIGTAIMGGSGLALGLASGGLAGINKPNDGFEDVKTPLKLLGAGVGVMALGGVAAGLLGARGNNPFATAAGGVAVLGAFMTFVGGASAGNFLVD